MTQQNVTLETDVDDCQAGQRVCVLPRPDPRIPVKRAPRIQILRVESFQTQLSKMKFELMQATSILKSVWIYVSSLDIISLDRAASFATLKTCFGPNPDHLPGMDLSTLSEVEKPEREATA